MPVRMLTALVQREGDGWVALWPELDVAGQGDTVDQAKANLREAVELFLETASQAELEQRLHTETCPEGKWRPSLRTTGSPKCAGLEATSSCSGQQPISR